jgi:hypothetical protein
VPPENSAQLALLRVPFKKSGQVFLRTLAGMSPRSAASFCRLHAPRSGGLESTRRTSARKQVANIGQDSVDLHRVGSAWVGAALVALGVSRTSLRRSVTQIRRAIERGDVGAPHAFVVYVFGITATLVGRVMPAWLKIGQLAQFVAVSSSVSMAWVTWTPKARSLIRSV